MVGWGGWETADLAGLTAGVSSAMSAMPARRHDPGRTLAQVVLALADGATWLADLAALGDQPAMFGPVASEAMVWRTFNQIGPASSDESTPLAPMLGPGRGLLVPVPLAMR